MTSLILVFMHKIKRELRDCSYLVKIIYNYLYIDVTRN